VWLYTTLSYSTHLIQSKEDLPFVPSDSCVMDKKPSEPASKKWQHHGVPAQRAPKLLQLLTIVCIQMLCEGCYCCNCVRGCLRQGKKSEGFRQSVGVGNCIRCCLKTGRAAYSCPLWCRGQRDGKSAMLASEFTHSIQQSIPSTAIMMARWKRLPISAIGAELE
jgi:hypothetical protein